MSETRWSSRAVTTETFVGNYEAIHDALVGLARAGDGTARTLLASTETDDFITALVVADLFLGYINTLSHKLQAVHLNLIESCSEAENIIECLQDERSSECFSRLVQKAQQMLGRPLQLPRISYRTMHHPNAPAGDAEEHYLRNLYFSFLDHLLCEINARLCSVEVKALVPALSSISEEDIGSIQRFYGPDLPDYGHLHQEVRRWKKKWEGFGESLSIERGLEEARGFYPNIYVILHLLLTIPVSTASPERSFSCLRRLKTWLRSTMVEDRLTSLALLHIHRELASALDPLDVLKQWDQSGSRRIYLAFNSTTNSS